MEGLNNETWKQKCINVVILHAVLCHMHYTEQCKLLPLAFLLTIYEYLIFLTIYFTLKLINHNSILHMSHK